VINDSSIFQSWKHCQGRKPHEDDDKGKGEVVPVLNEAPRHEDLLGEWRYRSAHSLTSALDGQWSASRTGRFSLRERVPNIHWIRRLCGPQSRSGHSVEEER
jgi:hypothetical protein